MIILNFITFHGYYKYLFAAKIEKNNLIFYYKSKYKFKIYTKCRKSFELHNFFDDSLNLEIMFKILKMIIRNNIVYVLYVQVKHLLKSTSYDNENLINNFKYISKFHFNK